MFMRKEGLSVAIATRVWFLLYFSWIKVGSKTSKSGQHFVFRLFLIKICSKWYLKLFLNFVEEQVYDPKQQRRGISEDINTLSRKMAGPCNTCITLVMFVLAFLHNLPLVESSSNDEQNSLTQVLLLTFIEYNHINVPVVTFQRLYCHLQNLKLIR